MFSRLVRAAGLGLAVLIGGDAAAPALGSGGAGSPTALAVSLTNHTAIVVDAETTYILPIHAAQTNADESAGTASATLQYDDPFAGEQVNASFTSTDNGQGLTFSYSLVYRGGESLTISESGLTVTDAKATYTWAFGQDVPDELPDALAGWGGRVKLFHTAFDVVGKKQNGDLVAKHPINNPAQDCIDLCDDDFPPIWPGPNPTPTQAFENCIQNSLRARCARECICLVYYNNWFSQQICLTNAVIAWEFDLAACIADFISPFGAVADRSPGEVTEVTDQLSIVVFD